MSSVETMTQKFRTLPRALQWSILAVIGLFLFMLWNSVLEPQRLDLNAQVVAIQGQVEQVRSVQDEFDRERASLPELIQALGQVDEPRDPTTSSKAIYDLVNELTKKYDVPSHNFAWRPTGLLPQKALGSLANGRRVERLTGDLKFEATPKSAAALIAALETSPAVESVNTVRLAKDSGEKVKVQLVLEAWVWSRQAATTGEAL